MANDPLGLGDRRHLGLGPPLVPAELLDPRPAEEAAAQPIRGAVNIPLAELPNRTHELPPRDVEVQVVGPADLALQAVEWLAAGERTARHQPEFEFALNGQPAQTLHLWRPSEFLLQVLTHLPPGTALDLACGTGRDAVYLASHGWQVTGLDLLPSAIALAQDLERRYVSGCPPVNWQVANLRRSRLRFGPTFDLITVFRFYDRELMPRLAKWLKPGGSLVWEAFTMTHREQHGRPSRPTHTVAPDELWSLLSGLLEMREYSEDWRGTLHTARAWAVKV